MTRIGAIPRWAFVCLLAIAIASAIAARRFHGPAKLANLRNRAVLRRMGASREDLKPKICFDLVGCFADPLHRTPLKRPPEHPSVIQTRFFLYTREEPDKPDVLEYGDNLESISRSRFNATKRLKVIVHGFKGSGSDAGALSGVKAILDTEDANVMILDWTRGAGTSYSAAVANTELVGRQLGLLVKDMIDLGTDPSLIHVMGFSLGAHVAGCASEVLKKMNILLGRITGLDPASPFFRLHLFRERSRKLDATDARLVDVIHTDGSSDFTDGFGLLKPIGHVDFFPNGGREQPGCVDVKNAVVVSHFNDEFLDRNIACSHLRAWQLFVESVKAQRGSGCKFVAWPCPKGATSYAKGVCFPPESSEWSQEMGYAADGGPLGIYYLPTRGERPFCGVPMRASARTSEGAPKTSGVLFLKLVHGNSTTTFRIRCELSKRRNEWTVCYGISAMNWDASPTDAATLRSMIWYEPDAEEREGMESAPQGSIDAVLFVDELALEDRKGNRWEYCNANIAMTKREMYVELDKLPS